MQKNFVLMFLLLTALFCDSAYTGEPSPGWTFQVEGSAPVIKNDVAFAREESVKNALEQAIMRAAAKVLSEKYEDEKFQAMKSIMIGKADRYIKNYRMISEGRQGDAYTVHVNAVVASAPVREDLLQMGVLQDQSAKESISVALSLRGVKEYSDFAGLKTFLQNRPKIVKSIYPCRMEWGQVQFDLAVVGSLKNLVADLEKTGRYSLESTQKGQGGVEINLQIKEEVR